MSLLLFLFLGSAFALDLDEATQREFAYLRAEKDALTERIATVRAEAGTRAASAEAEVQRLQGRLLGLRTERARVEEVLLDAEREQATLDEQRDLLESTLFQADATLDGFEVPEGEPVPADQAKALRAAMAEAARRLTEAGTARREAGTFYLADGTKVDGELVHLGRIATFGVADEGAGTLVPVGDGQLQLRDGPAGSAAALAAGAAPETIGLFLHEGVGKRVEEAPPKTWSGWIASGGVVGLVIIGLGFAAVLLAVLRGLGLLLAGRGGALPRTVGDKLEAGDRVGALSLVTAGSSPTARVLRSLLRAPDNARLDDVGAEAILRETPAIERFGVAIMVVAAVAPLLGLLGTVTGMIGTFDIITEFGTGDPRMLSGGISEALVTTQLGLIVAIPTLLAGNLLNRMADGVLSRLEIAALMVINRVDVYTPEPEDEGYLEIQEERSGRLPHERRELVPSAPTEGGPKWPTGHSARGAGRQAGAQPGRKPVIAGVPAIQSGWRPEREQRNQAGDQPAAEDPKKRDAGNPGLDRDRPGFPESSEAAK